MVGRAGSLVNRGAALKQVRRSETAYTPEGTLKSPKSPPPYPGSLGSAQAAVVLPGLRQSDSRTPTRVLAGKWGCHQDSDPQHGVTQRSGVSEEPDAHPVSQPTLWAPWGPEATALRDS